MLLFEAGTPAAILRDLNFGEILQSTKINFGEICNFGVLNLGEIKKRFIFVLEKAF